MDMPVKFPLTTLLHIVFKRLPTDDIENYKIL